MPNVHDLVRAAASLIDNDSPLRDERYLKGMADLIASACAEVEDTEDARERIVERAGA